jgi:hypothetical protein
MRDDHWLNQRLKEIWEFLFPEVPKPNLVIAKFKGKWKNKFGHIKGIKNKNTEIAINGIFQDPIVPEFIIDLTLAHELIHYMHGFHSPLPRQYKHPHAGGIVTRELKKRGFEHLMKKEKIWIRNTWPQIIKEKMPEKIKRRSPFRFF